MIKEAIGGLSLVKFDISGYNLIDKDLLFSTAKCLHFKQPTKVIFQFLLQTLLKFRTKTEENNLQGNQLNKNHLAKTELPQLLARLFPKKTQNLQGIKLLNLSKSQLILEFVSKKNKKGSIKFSLIRQIRFWVTVNNTLTFLYNFPLFSRKPNSK